jgi:hypothetical protein
MTYSWLPRSGGLHLNTNCHLNVKFAKKLVYLSLHPTIMTSEYFTTETLVLQASQAFERGEYPSIHAAYAIGAHCRTLNRYKERATRSDRPATSRLLTEDEGKGLCIWIDRLNRLRTRPSQQMLEYKCNHLLARRYTGQNTRPPHCGGSRSTLKVVHQV